MERSHASSSARTRKSRGTASKDAIALLKADHRLVEGWFSQFKKAKSVARRSALASKICGALQVHMRIEEEVFYPAFLVATRDKDLHHEAEVEHDGREEADRPRSRNRVPATTTYVREGHRCSRR